MPTSPQHTSPQHASSEHTSPEQRTQHSAQPSSANPEQTQEENPNELKASFSSLGSWTKSLNTRRKLGRERSKLLKELEEDRAVYEANVNILNNYDKLSSKQQKILNQSSAEAKKAKKEISQLEADLKRTQNELNDLKDVHIKALSPLRTYHDQAKSTYESLRKSANEIDRQVVEYSKAPNGNEAQERTLKETAFTAKAQLQEAEQNYETAKRNYETTREQYEREEKPYQDDIDRFNKELKAQRKKASEAEAAAKDAQELLAHFQDVYQHPEQTRELGRQIRDNERHEQSLQGQIDTQKAQAKQMRYGRNSRMALGLIIGVIVLVVIIVIGLFALGILRF